MTDAKKNKANPPTKVVGGPVRFSYVHVFVPTSVHPDNPEKAYSVSLLIPKSDKELVKTIKRAIQAAVEQGIETAWKGKKPANLRYPLRDGDEERPDDEVYAGHYFIGAKSKQRPSILDKDKEPIISEDEFYSGCYGRFSIKFFPYNAAGNKGIGCQLNHLQKTRDGERLGGRASADEDFSDDWKDDGEDDGDIL